MKFEQKWKRCVSNILVTKIETYAGQPAKEFEGRAGVTGLKLPR